MGALTRNWDSGRGENWRWHPEIISWNRIGQNRDALRRLGDAPFGLDGIIVSRLGPDSNTGGGARHVHVQVNGSGYVGVIQFLGVNMEKRRLQEAPEQGGDAQNGAGYPHDILPIYHQNMAISLRS